MADGHFAVTVL